MTQVSLRKMLIICMFSRILWLLVNHGAQVRQRNMLGLTAVHLATGNGNSEAIEVCYEVTAERFSGSSCSSLWHCFDDCLLWAATQGNLLSYFNSFNILQPIDPSNKHTLHVYTVMKWYWTPVIVHWCWPDLFNACSWFGKCIWLFGLVWSRYLAFFLSCLMLIPGYIIVWPVSCFWRSRRGITQRKKACTIRRWSSSFCLFIAKLLPSIFLSNLKGRQFVIIQF